MNFQRIVRKSRAAKYLFSAEAKPTFSQAGEDVIVQYLFQLLDIKNPTYLDIGASLPVLGNNTYFFYNKGFRGVCIEPDPELYAMLVKARPGDILLNIGVGLEDNSVADLHIFPHPYRGWNSFSKEEAERRQQETGVKIQEVKALSLQTVNHVLKTYFKSTPNFISLDVEGLDLDILRSMDFEKFHPEVICVETISFSTDLQEVKSNEIIDFLQARGYFIFADTHINTIFCRKESYKKNKS